jgi:hypothetical protein
MVQRTVVGRGDGRQKGSGGDGDFGGAKLFAVPSDGIGGWQKKHG